MENAGNQDVEAAVRAGVPEHGDTGVRFSAKVRYSGNSYLNLMLNGIIGTAIAAALGASLDDQLGIMLGTIVGAVSIYIVLMKIAFRTAHIVIDGDRLEVRNYLVPYLNTRKTIVRRRSEISAISTDEKREMNVLLSMFTSLLNVAAMKTSEVLVITFTGGENVRIVSSYMNEDEYRNLKQWAHTAPIGGGSDRERSSTPAKEAVSRAAAQGVDQRILFPAAVLVSVFSVRRLIEMGHRLFLSSIYPSPSEAAISIVWALFAILLWATKKPERRRGFYFLTLGFCLFAIGSQFYELLSIEFFRSRGTMYIASMVVTDIPFVLLTFFLFFYRRSLWSESERRADIVPAIAAILLCNAVFLSGAELLLRGGLFNYRSHILPAAEIIVALGLFFRNKVVGIAGSLALAGLTVFLGYSSMSFSLPPLELAVYFVYEALYPMTFFFVLFGLRNVSFGRSRAGAVSREAGSHV